MNCKYAFERKSVNPQIRHAVGSAGSAFQKRSKCSKAVESAKHSEPSLRKRPRRHFRSSHAAALGEDTVSIKTANELETFGKRGELRPKIITIADRIYIEAPVKFHASNQQDHNFKITANESGKAVQRSVHRLGNELHSPTNSLFFFKFPSPLPLHSISTTQSCAVGVSNSDVAPQPPIEVCLSLPEGVGTQLILYLRKGQVCQHALQIQSKPPVELCSSVLPPAMQPIVSSPSEDQKHNTHPRSLSTAICFPSNTLQTSMDSVQPAAAA
ncbi:hypothetical protein C8R45DRAFT_938070 [Mycena sanguinolenta]|nr:hypothetical protein C8R45DRAFT_938070 [Mycena sanguinolenta]